MEHLHPSTVALLELSDAERIARCKLKRWIPYPGARTGYQRLRELLEEPRQQRPDNLLVLAPTGNGKSMILERFRDQNPAQDNPEGETALVQVLHVEVPDEPTLDMLRIAILERLFAPYNPRSTKADRRREVFQQLEKTQVKVLLIDELHNLQLASVNEREKILAFFRAIGNELRINLVMAGIQEARRTLQSDPQLLNRFDLHRLPLWRDGDDYRVLLASFESLFPLRKPSHLAENDQLASFILYKSDGLIGEISKVLRRAAEKAIQSGAEAITEKVLRAVNYQSPSERKVEVSDLEP